MKVLSKALSVVALMVSYMAVGVGADADAPGTAVTTVEAEAAWWYSLPETEQCKLKDLFEPEWFDDQTTETQIAHCYVAQSLYNFLADPNLDSRDDDSYTGFAPLLLRASFHAAGTFHAPSGTGGTKDGSIFTQGELDDDSNACLEPAVRKLEGLFVNSPRVSLADAMVIAGSVALDSMDFPRMDLLRITGGRNEVMGLAWRDRLPSNDANPSELFREAYGMTSSELTAFIGGGHNFGSAHGVCSGYVGAWTRNPTSWKAIGDPNGSEFFVDLLEEDWRWYEVCTYKNGVTIFTSIPDPFSGDDVDSDSDSDEEEDLDECAVANSEIPLFCESQAMRGCEFADGPYPPNDPAIAECIFRLKSDFFLKIDPVLLPFSMMFAEDDADLAEHFGQAYHKLTHAGLERCGLSGFGCGDKGVCEDVFDDDGKYLTSFCEVKRKRKGGRGKKGMEDESDEEDGYVRRQI